MKTFIIELTFNSCYNDNNISIILGKTVAKDELEAHENICKKFNTESHWEIAKLYNDGYSVNDVEIFYYNFDEMETI